MDQEIVENMQEFDLKRNDRNHSPSSRILISTLWFF
jgi:hypothetical protein